MITETKQETTTLKSQVPTDIYVRIYFPVSQLQAIANKLELTRRADLMFSHEGRYTAEYIEDHFKTSENLFETVAQCHTRILAWETKIFTLKPNFPFKDLIQEMGGTPEIYLKANEYNYLLDLNCDYYMGFLGHIPPTATEGSRVVSSGSLCFHPDLAP